MEPFLIVLLPGLFGGIALSLVFARLRHWLPAPHPGQPLPAPSASLINMAHIHVEGPGGLGLVAMAGAVAFAEPHIRAATMIALLLAVPFGATLIALRSRRGPLASSHPGAHSILPLER